MIRQAKLLYCTDTYSNLYRQAIDCKWLPVTKFPHICCDRLNQNVINLKRDFWGKLALAINGKYMTYYFAFDTPTEAGQIVAYYISYWTGYREANDD